MKGDVKMGNKNSELSDFRISMEEFDAITEEHTFSDRYHQKKNKILTAYKRRKNMGKRILSENLGKCRQSKHKPARGN